MLRLVWLVVGLGVVLVGYSNCILQPNHSVLSSSSQFASLCSGSFEKVFFDTYHQPLRTNCASCHANGPGFFQFASSDFNVAYREFMSAGRAKVEANMVNPNHKPPWTGTQHTALAESLKSAWLEGESEQQTKCGNTGPKGASVLTIGKSQPSIFTTSPGDNNNWPEINWDLTRDLSEDSIDTPFPLELSLQIRRAQYNGSVVGYEFKNLRGRLLIAGDSYKIDGIHVYLNGRRLQELTTFDLISTYINQTTLQALAPNGAFGLAVLQNAIVSSDIFGLEIDSIMSGTAANNGNNTNNNNNNQTPLPTRVTHTQLVNDNTIGIFRQSCNNCHNNNNAAGGLNLLNYTQSAQAASQIRARMNDANNPMPPSGILSDRARQIVDIWINMGTPQ